MKNTFLLYILLYILFFIIYINISKYVLFIKKKLNSVKIKVVIESERIWFLLFLFKK